MMKFFLPHHTDFFELFQTSSGALVEVAQLFNELLNNLENPEKHIQAIDIHEQKAHKITNSTLEKLHKTFITPFDRYDIHRFVKKLDDVVDAIQRTGHRVVIYQLTTVPQEIHALAGLGVRAAKIIQAATLELHSLKNATKILQLCDTVTPLESEAEHLLLSGVSELFQSESDLRILLKTKEIYEHTKSIINGCQIVTNIIKDIVLEYS